MLTAKSVLFKKLNFSVKDCVIVGKHEAELRKDRFWIGLRKNV